MEANRNGETYQQLLTELKRALDGLDVHPFLEEDIKRSLVGKRGVIEGDRSEVIVSLETAIDDAHVWAGENQIYQHALEELEKIVAHVQRLRNK